MDGLLLLQSCEHCVEVRICVFHNQIAMLASSREKAHSKHITEVNRVSETPLSTESERGIWIFGVHQT